MAMSFISQFKSIPKYGIIVLVNKQDNQAYTIFSQSLPTLFCTTLCKLKEGIHDNKLLQDAFNNDLLTLEIVKGYESDPGSTELRNAYEVYTRNSGYKDMRVGYKATSYKLKKYVLNHFRADLCYSEPLVYVCGRSPTLGEIVLGIFHSIPEANEWVSSVYGDKLNDILPVFVDNELTKEYHKLNGYKICR
jgi:hypothetical protein